MTALVIALVILLAFLSGAALAWASIAHQAAQDATRANRSPVQPGRPA